MPNKKQPTDSHGKPIHGTTTGDPWPPLDEDDYFFQAIQKIGHELELSKSGLLTDRALSLLIEQETLTYHNAQWIQHTFVEHNDVGDTLYIAHPYRLDKDDLYILRRLQDHGYRVKITGASAYCPGATIRVELMAPPEHPFTDNTRPDTTWLYRMYDNSGALLYIGISKSAFSRFERHSAEKPWINNVTSWNREPYPTREAALEAERAAIKTEHPLHNIIHNGQQGQL